MLKTRIIPMLLCRGRELVKGERFASWRRVGNTLQAARVHNMRQVDELCILSLDGMMDLDDAQTLCADCFMPVSIGGGVSTLEDFRALLWSGADKVVIRKHELIAPASEKFGAQAVVFCINHCDGDDSVGIAKDAQERGAGEILLQSVERDGTMQGYDLETLSRVAEAVHVPVIASGGCGLYSHMAQALNAGAHAVAAGAMFLFSDSTPAGAARYLHEHGFNTRMDYAA